MICNMQAVKRRIEVTMMTMIALLKEFLKDEGGQGLTEYLLVVALTALATVAGMNNPLPKPQVLSIPLVTS